MAYRIRDAVSHMFHSNQHGYISGRSVDSALHFVVDRIEKALKQSITL